MPAHEIAASADGGIVYGNHDAYPAEPFRGICCHPVLIGAASGDALDTRSLFQNIAKGMHLDFQKSAQVLHSGSKGTVRENVLKQFLEEGRLPERYAIGSGEVVGRVKDTSRQCDLLIYDRDNGVKLLFDRDVQVYPIDCVYGVIEVKSSLSKAELIDSLEKIRTLKEMAPGEAVDSVIGGGYKNTARPAQAIRDGVRIFSRRQLP